MHKTTRKLALALLTVTIIGIAKLVTRGTHR